MEDTVKLVAEHESAIRQVPIEMSVEFYIPDILDDLRKNGYAKVYEDYSSFESGKSCDGGSYGYWTNAHLLQDEEGLYFELEKRTTCDAFDYCGSCGSFNTHRYCQPTQISI